jgi:hypothetical protein
MHNDEGTINLLRNNKNIPFFKTAFKKIKEISVKVIILGQDEIIFTSLVFYF